MQDKFNQLKEINDRITALGAALTLLNWDRDVNMPPGGGENRGFTMAQLGRMTHELATSDEMGALIEALEPWAFDHGPDSFEACYLARSRYLYDRSTKVPPELVMAFLEATSTAQMVWAEARQNNDFGMFRPHLEKILDLNRAYAEYFKPYDHVYDTLLDSYEPQMKTADVRAIFAEIRPKQVALVEAIREAAPVDDACLHQPFDPQRQIAFGREVIRQIGYDLTRGRQDPVTHPYMANMGYGDQRITYRVDKDWFNPYFFSALHEAGHATYEQGLPKAFWRSPLYGAASQAIHESQSRLWENLVGRSLPFWEFFYPQLQEAFPAQFENVPLDTFYRAVNRVAPSLIRVEADEATYNLHIMLRLELEIELIEGSLAVADLPEIWNARMEEYLGILPPDDSDGVLQDVHWSMGAFGYFSTYALGNLASVQLWEKMQETHPDVDEQMRCGEFEGILGWMNENVHAHGAKYFPQELMEKVTGSKIDGGPYIGYLENKYAEIYRLLPEKAL